MYIIQLKRNKCCLKENSQVSIVRLVKVSFAKTLHTVNSDTKNLEIY